MKEYGHFTENGYKITERETPRHWYNYLYNDEYVTFISQVGFGQGLAQDPMGRRIMPVDDRAVYIADGECFWQANGLPIQLPLDEYYCEHAIGYTDIVESYRGIHSEVRLFVPNEGKREILRVIVRNDAAETKTVKVIPYCGTAIGCVYKPQGYETDWGKFYEEKNSAVGTGFSSFGGNGVERFYAYMTATETVTGFDTRKNAFVGAYGNKNEPKTLMEKGGCSNTDCIAEKLCLALENTVTLAPGESKAIYYTMGVEASVEEIPAYTAEEIEAQFAAMQAKYAEICGGVSIKTPWDDFNNLFNDWLKYQTNMGSRWARVRHNGIRDLTSDTECLGCFDAPLAAERLTRVMDKQYENGYAPRTFIDGKVKDNNFSDNMVWMVYAVHAVTKELGDTGYLLREVPFNNGAVGTVYDHVKRSVEFLWQFTGHHGLVRIWGGDWNDCMNDAGMGGKGVSVWLSIAFVRAAKMLAQMAQWLGKDEDAEMALSYAKAMEERVNIYGWNGDRYIYAISDDEHLIGAKECEEASMFALPQLWSVFADFDKEHSLIAMDTLEKELNTDLGLLVSNPPFTKQLPYIGSMTRKYPGLHENGGPYLHAAVWKLAVDSMLQRNDKIEEGYHKILPGHHQYFETCGEPYAMFNSYLGVQTGYRAGKPGQSWRTATGQWLLYSTVRFVYGLQPEFEGLLLKPCLPPSWKDCSISKKFRGCTYNVHYVQKGEGACNTIESVTVNGTAVDGTQPIAPVAGEVLNIEVVLTA